MTIQVLAFGIVKEIFSGQSVSVTLSDAPTVNVLRKELKIQFPQLNKLASYMIAVNDEYADDSQLIYSGDNIAVIPPVSGG